jgi:K+-sensing histidine kinase KdpD
MMKATQTPYKTLHHDIRNQLTSVIGNVVLLRRLLENKHIISVEEQLMMLQDIEQAARNINVIIDIEDQKPT